MFKIQKKMILRDWQRKKTTRVTVSRKESGESGEGKSTEESFERDDGVNGTY